MGYNLVTSVNKVTIGADPEVFLCNSKGLPVPACGLIGGTKEAPVPVPKGALQEDNVMAEFNIDPCLTADEFVSTVNTVYAELVSRASMHELSVLAIPSATFPKFLLDMHPAAREFGCDPDFNAYTGEVNPTPDVRSNLRTCAGHIHLGYECASGSDMVHVYESLVRALDWVVGCWTVIQDRDTVRRERYGKAGAFRPKPYGLEYRVPSNFWLKTDSLKRSMFNRVRTAYGIAMSKTEMPDPNAIVAAINSHDVVACHHLLGRYA